MNEKVAIIIPTINRSDFLIRQLKYYKSVNSNHPVYIGDSSDEDEKNKLLNSLDRFRDCFEINYYFFPKDEGIVQDIILQLAKNVKEKYCVFNGDDDFLIPNSLNKCANFLEKNSEYRTAQGIAVLFNLDNKGAYGKFNYFEQFWDEPQSLENSAKDRVLNYAKNYWGSQYSVHRKKEFLQDSEDYKNNRDNAFSELIHCFTFISRGKSKFIDCLYLLRQAHDNRLKNPHFFEWIADPHWNKYYNLFINSISIILEKEDGISSEDAKLSAYKVFWLYYLPIITNSLEEFKQNNSMSKTQFMEAKMLLKKYLSHRNIEFFKMIKKKLTYSKKKLLSAFKSKQSKYYDDFIPLYRNINK